jgi:ribosome-associated protein
MRDIDFESEFVFRASRSGGKGGQNVNKVSTKIELDFDIAGSKLLDEAEKETLLAKLKNKTDKNGILRIVSQSERSQLLNKLDAIKKFDRLIEKAFKKEKIRRKTKPSITSKEERLSSKKIESQKKSFRSKNFLNDI